MSIARRDLLKLAGAGIVAPTSAIFSANVWGQGANEKKVYALHIGVNRVDGNAYGGNLVELTGCVSDGKKMESIAKRAFESQSAFKSKFLENNEATIEQVAAHILWAAKDLNKDDLFFCSYAGHGGQLPDRSSDETDRRDETWCLYNGQLRDDHLYQMFRQFKEGVRILVVSDSCHSGTVARDQQQMRAMAREIGIEAAMINKEVEGNARGIFGTDLGELSRKSRSLESAARSGDQTSGVVKDLRFRSMNENEARKDYESRPQFYDRVERGLGAGDKLSRNQIPATGLLLAACQDHQVAWENNQGGVFTDAFTRAFHERATAGVKSTYDQFLSQVASKMPDNQAPNFFPFGNESGRDFYTVNEAFKVLS